MEKKYNESCPVYISGARKECESRTCPHNYKECSVVERIGTESQKIKPENVILGDRSLSDIATFREFIKK